MWMKIRQKWVSGVLWIVAYDQQAVHWSEQWFGRVLDTVCYAVVRAISWYSHRSFYCYFCVTRKITTMYESKPNSYPQLTSFPTFSKQPALCCIVCMLFYVSYDIITCVSLWILLKDDKYCNCTQFDWIEIYADRQQHSNIQWYIPL